jgi:hypothetical protein
LSKRESSRAALRSQETSARDISLDGTRISTDSKISRPNLILFREKSIEEKLSNLEC